MRPNYATSLSIQEFATFRTVRKMLAPGPDDTTLWVAYDAPQRCRGSTCHRGDSVILLGQCIEQQGTLAEGLDSMRSKTHQRVRACFRWSTPGCMASVPLSSPGETPTHYSKEVHLVLMREHIAGKFGEVVVNLDEVSSSDWEDRTHNVSAIHVDYSNSPHYRNGTFLACVSTARNSVNFDLLSWMASLILYWTADLNERANDRPQYQQEVEACFSHYVHLSSLWDSRLISF
jgi:hypothetical protein